MKELVCEFCETEHSSDPEQDYDAVDMYKIGGKVVFSCVRCLEANVAKDDRVPFELPAGWGIIEDSTLKGYLEQKRAIIAVNEEMRKAEHLPPSDSYYAHPAGRLKDMFGRLNSQIEHNAKFMESVGLSGVMMEDMISGAYCPACKGPLIEMVGIKQKHALQCAASDLVQMMEESRGRRNRKVLCCLQCGTAYIGDKNHD